MSSSVELDGRLESDELFDGTGVLRGGGEGGDGLFCCVQVGDVGLVVLLVVQFHDLLDDMRLEGLSFHDREVSVQCDHDFVSKV